LRQRRKLRVTKLRERKPRANHHRKSHRKSKRKSKKEKEGRNREEKNKFNPCKLLQVAGTQCGKGASQHKQKGPYQVPRHPHIHPLHEHSFFQGSGTI